MTPKLSVRPAAIAIGVLAAFATLASPAQDLATPSDSAHSLVPRQLLSLVHAPEVHQELKLSPDQVAGLEALLEELDPVWFPARILPTDQRLATIRQLEQRLLAWFKSNASPGQVRRLRQLECHAQGPRTILRDDVGRAIGLEPSQRTKLVELARATDGLQQALARAKYGEPEVETLQQQLAAAIQAERTELTERLTQPQRVKLGELVGPAFDTTQLKRIFPKAPELQPVEHWLHSSPLTLQELRGKVVLVHFYAFQCHNCHANFAIYERWHQTFADRGVVVLGIQTPETKREREPDAVRAAAIERGLSFPILIDLESKNWNAWGNTMWPTVYVVDQQGYIRHWWQGELNWKGATGDETIEGIVEELLAESPESPSGGLGLSP